MGDYAEMMLDGTCCMACGEYLGSSNGYPTPCPNCEPDWDEILPRTPRQKKDTPCPVCKKKCRGELGLKDHLKWVHKQK